MFYLNPRLCVWFTSPTRSLDTTSTSKSPYVYLCFMYSENRWRWLRIYWAFWALRHVGFISPFLFSLCFSFLSYCSQVPFIKPISSIKSIFSFFLTIPSQVIPLPIKTIIPHILSVSNSHLRKKQKSTNLPILSPNSFFHNSKP